MDETIAQLTDYLVRYYFIDQENATLMVEDEFVFIEQCLSGGKIKIKDIAQELIDIYMVA